MVYASNLKLAVYIKNLNLLGIAWQIKAFHFAKEVIIFKFGVTLVQKKNSPKIQNSPRQWIIPYPDCDMSGASSSLLGGLVRSLEGKGILPRGKLSKSCLWKVIQVWCIDKYQLKEKKITCHVRYEIAITLAF